MLLWMTDAMKLVKILLLSTKDVKIQDGHQNKKVLGLMNINSKLGC